MFKLLFQSPASFVPSNVVFASDAVIESVIFAANVLTPRRGVV